MAKISPGAPLFFGALADSGHIRQRKNGSYKMVLKGVDEINWFTDRPDRVEGKWKPRQLQRKWNSYFANGEPNAQAGFKADDAQEMLAFEMFKPKIKKAKMIFNIKSISDAGEDLITALKGKELDDISLFIESETPGIPPCFPTCEEADLKNFDMSGQYLYGDFPFATLTNANLSDSKLHGANLSDANLRGANLEQADLDRANLRYADLTGADLTNAELFYADLSNAHLNGANLRYADLTYAGLSGADLNGANLRHADLNGANLLETIWGNTTCPDGTNSNDPGNSTCGF